MLDILLGIKIFFYEDKKIKNNILNNKNKVFLVFIISFLKVIVDLFATLSVGLLISNLLDQNSLLQNTFLSNLIRRSSLSADHFFLLFFSIFYVFKIIIDFLKSFFVNKIAYEIWKSLIEKILLSISKAKISRENLFKSESIILSETINAVWNYFVPLTIVVSEILFLSILFFYSAFLLKNNMLFIALPIVILIFISKYVKKKISIHSSSAVELRTVFGRNINLLLSSLPDLMISVNNYKDSILKKNINDMSLSYNKLFFTKEYFSYIVENFYLLIFFLIILIIDILFTKPVSNLTSPIIIFLVISLRLIPSINRIFGQIGLLTYGLKSLHQVSKYFNSKINLTKIKLIKNDIVIVKFSKKFKFFNKIKFRRKYFFDPGINVIKGANGSGKTTLLQIIFGINVGSKVVVYRNGAVGYLGQSYTCLNNKVSEELFFLTKNNNNLKETSSFTKKILLSSKIRMHDKIDNLSGGQRQLLSFCKIINQNPKIIILDEPLSSLDKKNIKYFIKILNYWKYNKKILIISDHTNIIKADRLVNI